jgi:hypothetical protein
MPEVGQRARHQRNDRQDSRRFMARACFVREANVAVPRELV